MGKWLTFDRGVMLLMTAFTFGVNWQGVWSQRERVDNLERDSPVTYVRKDVYASEQRALSDSVNTQTEIARELRDEIRQLLALEKETGEPVRVQRKAYRGAFDK